MKNLRYVMFVFVVAGILMGLAGQAASTSALEASMMADTMVFGMIRTSTLIGIFTAIGTFVGLSRYTPALTFVDEAVGELLKVTWPTRDETVKASTTVVLTTLFTAALLGAYDFVWNGLAKYFLFVE